MTNALQHIQKSVDGYKANQVIQNELSNEFSVLYGEGPVTGAIRSYDDVINKYGEAQQQFVDRVTADVIEPLKAYLEIFKEVKKRTDELSKRRTTMDHYNERRLKLAESTNTSKEKLPEYDSKYKHAKVNYEALLVELKNDLGALDEDIVSFICPIFANYVTYQNEFLRTVSGSFSVLPGQCSQVDGSAVHQHQSVITPLELSAMTNAAQPVANEQDDLPRRDLPQPRTSTRPLPSKPGRATPALRARALYDFTASDSTELGFNEGDVLNILERNGDWWQAELNGRRGQVPSNYLEMIR